jgi:hypothetical protein
MTNQTLPGWPPYGISAPVLRVPRRQLPWSMAMSRVRGERRLRALHFLRKEATMHATVNHVGVPTDDQREQPRDLSDWLLEAAIFMVVISIAALAMAYGVLLIIM